MATLTRPLPATRPAPAAPTAASSLRARLGRAGSALWRALEDFGYARARRDLALMAARYDNTNPELARQLRRFDR
jgi:hypothetical protein